MIKALKVRVLVLALGLFFASAAHGATILVTTRTDVIAVDGVVTLREALNSINAGADVNADVTANRVGSYGSSDTLTFNFVSGGGVIVLANALGALTITKTVNIMGFTQPTAVANSAVTGDNSNHQIVISGNLLGAGVDCMDITGQPSSGTQLRGFVFDQCPAAGLAISNSKNNVIAGDFFGTDSAGNFSAGAGNATGLSIAALAGTDDISGNQVGGPNPADHNVISGNTTREILIGNFGGATAVTTGISVRNSYIGMNAAGTTAVTGSQQGIFVQDITGATIGGASGSLGGSCSGVCNLISGSANGVGIVVQGSTPTSTSGTLIQGNFIGTDVTGTLARPNGQLAHIDVSQSATITIGGTAAGTGNLISGEPVQGTGILIDGGVVGPVNIQGNFIGTTTTGNALLANGGPGIHIVGSTNVNIGGTTASARNVIGGSGNGNTPKGPGISVEGNAPFSTGTAVIQGNNIGIGANGSTNIGNIGNGIDFTSNSTGSTVGASTSGGLGSNIIAFNGALRTNGAGIGVSAGSSAKILSNSIFSNTGITTGIGIDLSANGSATDGPTANDNCDGDSGGNTLQNFPVLTSAQSTGSSITIAGTLNSTASTTFTIEFFSNPAGTSQGRTFLGSTSTSTNGACSGAFNAVLAQTVSAGLNITATATDPSGNTSEFSAAVATTATLTAANASVTGRISDSYGNAIAGVSIRLNGTQTRLTITDSNGNYSFDGVETNGIYTVTPSRANYLFNPANRSFSSLGAHTEASFTGNANGDHANAIDTTEFFVRQQYLDFLGREPDPPGFNGWMNTLTNCAAGDASCDRIHVSQMFYQSPEFQERGYFAYRFYATALGRKPDYVEFMPDLQRVSGFLTQDQLSAAKNLLAIDFVMRPEFASRYGSLSDTAYVDQLINTASVTLTNRQSLIDSLTNRTATRAQVLREISESAEVYRKFYNQAFVVMEYFGYLRRDPDALYTNWIAELDRTGDPRQMVEGFVNSAEYRNRFVP